MERPVGLVVSGGRTGTDFCGRKLDEVFEAATVHHEADAIHRNNKQQELIRAVKRFGTYRGVIGKLAGRTGVGNLSARHLSGQLTARRAGEELLANRRSLYTQVPDQNLVIETNYSMFGLLPALPYAFTNYRVAAIVRRPQDCIRSWLRMGHRYGKRDWLHRVGLRITPMTAQDDEAASRWPRMTRAERLAWFWNLVYQSIHEAQRHDPNIVTFRFEDLFLSPDRCRHFASMARFLGTFDERTFDFEVPNGLLETVHNSSSRKRLDPRDGCPEQAAMTWCSPTAALWYPDEF